MVNRQKSRTLFSKVPLTQLNRIREK